MRRAEFVLALCLSLFLDASARAQPAPALPLRTQAQTRDAWLEHRLKTIAPTIMREAGTDMWVLIAREYNEDPILKTMLPATWISARRRTILVLHDPDGAGELERLAVARYDIGGFFQSAWSPDEEPDQWARLAQIIRQRNPQRIAVNTSSNHALADGLTHSEHKAFMAALDPAHRQRVASGETLAVRWLETRTEPEVAAYTALVAAARDIIHEALSEAAITPGVTTTEDLQWWLRERARALGYSVWFHPSVSVQRPRRDAEFIDLFTGEGVTILPGDLLHIDFGITSLGLNTDTQQMAYVLRPGETEAPQGLQDAFDKCNRLQDILTRSFAEGRTGDEILTRALTAAREEGLRPSVYSHPIGYHGHAAGPAIGMWDKQDGVPGAGALPLRPDTCWSIELNISDAVAEWDGQNIRIMLEEDAFFDGERVVYLAGRQRELLLIPRQERH